MPYVIRNCPANYPVLGREECLCGDTECQDCPNCVMKQIVELCKKAIKSCDKCKGDPEIDCCDCTEGGKARQSDRILKILDIQEVE